MRRIPAACALFVVAVPAASAGDLYSLPYEPEPPLRPAYDWSGSYAGVHGGYGWGKSTGVGSSGAGGAIGSLGGGGLLNGLLSGTTGILGDIDTGLLADLVEAITGEADLGPLSPLGDLIGDLLGGGGLPVEFDTLNEILAGVDSELSAVDLDLGLRGSGLDEFEGFVGGFQIGRNWQSGPIVAGVEADFSVSDMKENQTFSGSDTFTSVDVGGVLTIDGSVSVEGEVENELSWLGTLRGRLGIAENRFLLYGTGGVAFGDMHVAANVATSIDATVNVGGTPEVISETTSVSGSADDVMVGYTVGAGIEFAINDQWTTKLEYAYVNLGKIDVQFDDGTSSEVEVDMHLVKAGANYRF